MKEVERCEKKGHRPSIDRVLFKCFYFEILIYGLIVSVMELVIRMFQPIFLGLLLRYFNPRNANNDIP